MPPATFATLEIVAVGAKDQIVVASYDQDVTRVLAVYAAAAGTPVVVAYERRLLLRNLGDPEVVADAVGLDLTHRLGR
jgi:hypothetical protein